MFQTVDSGPSFGSLLLQLFLAYFGPTALLMAFYVRFSRNTPETPVSQILDYVFLAAAGIALALFVTAFVRNSTKVGIFVWILPVAIELYAAISESFSFGIASLAVTMIAAPSPDSHTFFSRRITMPLSPISPLDDDPSQGPLPPNTKPKWAQQLSAQQPQTQWKPTRRRAPLDTTSGLPGLRTSVLPE
jgi:hypothetical protein